MPAAKRKCSWTWGGRNESQLQSAMEINHNNMHCHEDILRQQDRHLQVNKLIGFLECRLLQQDKISF